MKKKTPNKINPLPTTMIGIVTFTILTSIPRIIMEKMYQTPKLMSGSAIYNYYYGTPAYYIWDTWAGAKMNTAAIIINILIAGIIAITITKTYNKNKK